MLGCGVFRPGGGRPHLELTRDVGLRGVQAGGGGPRLELTRHVGFRGVQAGGGGGGLFCQDLVLEGLFQAHLKPTSKVFVLKTWPWKGSENLARSKVGFRVWAERQGSLGFRVWGGEFFRVGCESQAWLGFRV